MKYIPMRLRTWLCFSVCFFVFLFFIKYFNLEKVYIVLRVLNLCMYGWRVSDASVMNISDLFCFSAMDVAAQPGTSFRKGPKEFRLRLMRVGVVSNSYCCNLLSLRFSHTLNMEHRVTSAGKVFFYYFSINFSSSTHAQKNSFTKYLLQKRTCL